MEGNKLPANGFIDSRFPEQHKRSTGGGERVEKRRREERNMLWGLLLDRVLYRRGMRFIWNLPIKRAAKGFCQ